MAVQRIWTTALLGVVLHSGPVVTLVAQGQEWQPLRAGNLVPVEKWGAKSCLSAARAALARGNLNEAEAWTQRAENAPLRYLDWVNNQWSNSTVKVWREIQRARSKEAAAQIAMLEMRPALQTREPPLSIQIKKMTEVIGRTTPTKNTTKDIAWKKEDLEYLRAYLKDRFKSNQQKSSLPTTDVSSIELLAAACNQFLEGNYQIARQLGFKARVLDSATISTLELAQPKIVAASENKEPVLVEMKSGAPALSRQQRGSFVEESEPFGPSEGNSPRGFTAELYMKVAVGMGGILVLLLWHPWWAFRNKFRKL